MITPITANNIKFYHTNFKGLLNVQRKEGSKDIAEKMFDEYILQLDKKSTPNKIFNKYLRNQRDVLENNKEETKRIFKILYNEMKKEYKMPARASESNVKWQPSMSLKEAELFAKNSKIKDTLYRASQNTEFYKKNGYNISRVDVYYPGVYFATSKEDAEIYGTNPLKAKVNVKNIKDIKPYLAKEKEIIEKETRSPEVKEALISTIGILGNVLAQEFNIDAFVDVKDFRDIVRTYKYYCVLDPKDIVIIDE